jgi:hypothetical protein
LGDKPERRETKERTEVRTRPCIMGGGEVLRGDEREAAEPVFLNVYGAQESILFILFSLW